MPSDWQLQDAAAPCWVPAIFPVPARGRASLLWCGQRGCSCRAPLAEHSLVKELLISTAFFVICTSRKWNYFSFAHSNFKPNRFKFQTRECQRLQNSATWQNTSKDIKFQHYDKKSYFLHTFFNTACHFPARSLARGLCFNATLCQWLWSCCASDGGWIDKTNKSCSSAAVLLQLNLKVVWTVKGIPSSVLIEADLNFSKSSRSHLSGL